jgi:hypothetical protein
VSNGALAVLASLALLVLPGCVSTDAEVEPQAISGAPKRVATVVERLERATRAGDYGTICDRLLTPAARLRAGGEGCEASLRESVGELRRPRIRILSITIEGDRALARVRTRAEGQGAVDETIELERLGRRYRIAALAG